MALNIERLDMTFLKRSLCKHESGLSVLPHPVQLEDISLIHEEHLGRLIGLLRASYSQLIFDLSKRFTPTDLTAMRMSDVILLVAQLELTSLRNVVRMLHTLSQDGDLADKVKVIVNRVGSDDGGEITLAKAEETIGRPIYWQIPNDFKPMVGSRNAGVPLLTHAPKSKAQIAIRGLGQRPVRQGAPEAAQERTPQLLLVQIIGIDAKRPQSPLAASPLSEGSTRSLQRLDFDGIESGSQGSSFG